MDNIKGIIFTLESLLKTAKKGMLSNKVLVDSNEAFMLLDKLKRAIEKIEEDQKPVEVNDFPETD